MICCLNPDCERPLNKIDSKICDCCGSTLKLRLRNRYQPVKPLGKGGFGKTYLAKDLDRLEQFCVIKQLTFMSDRPTAVAKAKKLFKLEAEQLQKLGQHSQIPALLAYFEEDNFLYLVQEFIDGENLLEKLAKEGRFTEEKILNLLSDLLPVLEFVHSQNVIHRDLKPGNIMLRAEDGKHVLIDFGVSKVFNPTQNVATGTILGSQGFSPPEQIVGGKSLPASDLFSLGTTCFYLLSGTSPFDLWVDRGYSWIENWQESLGISLNPPLDFVLAKLLEKQLDRRYNNAAEVIKDLKRPATVIQSKELPQTALDKTTLMPESLKNTIKISVLFIVVLGTGMYGLYQFAPQFYSKKDNKIAVEESNKNLKEIEIDRLEDLEINAQDEVWSLAISPDGKIIAEGNKDSNIYLYDRETGAQKDVLSGHENIVRYLVFIPKTNKLISGDGDGIIKIWNLNASKLEKKLEKTLSVHNNSSIWSLVVSPDGKTLVSTSEDKSVRFWDLTTGDQIANLLTHNDIVYAVAVTPDGNTYASGDAGKNIKIWDAKDRKLLRTLQGHQDRVRSLAITPDGKYLISGSWDRTVKIWELTSGELIHNLPGHTDNIVTLAVSNDSEILFSGSTDNTIKVWRIADGKLLDTLDRHSGWVLALANSLQEDLLVSGSQDKTIEFWQYKYTNKD